MRVFANSSAAPELSVRHSVRERCARLGTTRTMPSDTDDATERPEKRVKLVDDNDEEKKEPEALPNESKSEQTPLHKRPFSEKLSFGDGNIIIATDDMLFCVYMGILANSSQIFKDMFSIPLPKTQEMFIGRPVVELQGETGEEFEIFLVAMFNRG